MQLLKLKPHLNEEEIKEITFSQKSVRDFQDWQIIYLIQRNKNKKAEEIAELLGVNVYKIYDRIELYNKYGKDWKNIIKWGGRRNETSYLSIEDEMVLMNDLSDKALKGFILTAADIRKQIESKVGREVSDDYIWDLFKRQGWSKKSPMPKHPKRDKEKQEGFKKNSGKAWMP
jgi:transposase